MLIENRLTIAAAKDPRGPSADVMLEAAADLARLRTATSFYSRWVGYLAWAAQRALDGQLDPPFRDTDRPPCDMQSPAASDGSGRGQRRDVARPERKGKVAGGPAHHNVTVTMDDTLTEEERDAVSAAYGMMNERAAKLQERPDTREAARPFIQRARALQGLFERLGGGR